MEDIQFKKAIRIKNLNKKEKNSIGIMQIIN